MNPAPIQKADGNMFQQPTGRSSISKMYILERDITCVREVVIGANGETIISKFALKLGTQSNKMEHNF